MERYTVSKRTAIRMKDMVKVQFPQIQEISGAYNTKKWYIPRGTLGNYIGFSLNEINALQNAIKLMKSKLPEDVEALELIDNISVKIKIDKK